MINYFKILYNGLFKCRKFAPGITATSFNRSFQSCKKQNGHICISAAECDCNGIQLRNKYHTRYIWAYQKCLTKGIIGYDVINIMKNSYYYYKTLLKYTSVFINSIAKRTSSCLNSVCITFFWKRVVHLSAWISQVSININSSNQQVKKLLT